MDLLNNLFKSFYPAADQWTAETSLIGREVSCGQWEGVFCPSAN